MNLRKRDFLYKKATEELLGKAAVIDKEISQLNLNVHYSLSYLTNYLRTIFTNKRAMDFVFDAPRKVYTYSSFLCDTLALISEATGGNKFWRVKYISSEEWDEGPHWYLETKSGIVFDITYDQYSVRKINIPYNLSNDFTNLPLNQIGNIGKTNRLAQVCNIDFQGIVMKNQSKNQNFYSEI